jgi:hypothetical protein
MSNIYQSLSQVSKQSDTSGEKVPEPSPAKPVESKAASTKVKSADHSVEKKVPGVAEIQTKTTPKTIPEIPKKFFLYIDKLKNNITESKKLKGSDLSSSEEKISNKTFHCLTNIENFIESHIHDSGSPEKLDELKLTDDMKEILDENNAHDVMRILRRMDRKIAKENESEALLNYEVSRYLIGVLKDVSLPRQIGRIWA